MDTQAPMDMRQASEPSLQINQINQGLAVHRVVVIGWFIDGAIDIHN